MKTTILATLILGSLLTDCASNDPKPKSVAQVWSQGCAELAPDKDTYLLSGQCCTYIEFPFLNLSSGQSFSVQATKYSSGRSGNSTQKITLQGQVSRDGGTLTLSYDSTVFEFKPGPALVVCDCLCL